MRPTILNAVVLDDNRKDRDGREHCNNWKEVNGELQDEMGRVVVAQGLWCPIRCVHVHDALGAAVSNLALARRRPSKVLHATMRKVHARVCVCVYLCACVCRLFPPPLSGTCRAFLILSPLSVSAPVEKPLLVEPP